MPKRIELDIDQIAKRYQAGESAQAIADDLNVSLGTIDNRLKRAGVVKRPVGRPRKYDEAEACRLYKAELPITEIMERMGISGSYMLYSILNRNGVPLRNSYPKPVEIGTEIALYQYSTTPDPKPVNTEMAMYQYSPARKKFLDLIHRVNAILAVSPDRRDSDIAESCGCLPIFVERQRYFRMTMGGSQTV